MSENVFEERNRAVKAVRLERAFNALCDRYPLGPVPLTERSAAAARMSQGVRDKLAASIDVTPPSEETWAVVVRLLEAEPYDCPHGDPTCPCRDGDACHYESYPATFAYPASEALPCPRTGVLGCHICTA